MQYHGYRNFRAKVKYHCNCELAQAQLEEHKMMAKSRRDGPDSGSGHDQQIVTRNRCTSPVRDPDLHDPWPDPLMMLLKETEGWRKRWWLSISK